MTKRQQIDARVEAQLASLRAALQVQFERMAPMQAELDVLPQARQRRNILRGLLASGVAQRQWLRRAAGESRPMGAGRR